MLLGLLAAVPQILRMHARRSCSGQSMTGWAMGLACNAALGYLNLTVYQAFLLGTANLMSVVMCMAAIWLIWRFSGSAGECSHRRLVHDLPTTEFEALASAVRERERQLTTK